ERRQPIGRKERRAIKHDQAIKIIRTERLVQRFERASLLIISPKEIAWLIIDRQMWHTERGDDRDDGREDRDEPWSMRKEVGVSAQARIAAGGRVIPKNRSALASSVCSKSPGSTPRSSAR